MNENKNTTEKVACVICIFNNEVLSTNFFHDYDKACECLESSVCDEVSKMISNGIKEENITIDRDCESVTLLWHASRDSLLAENPNYPEEQLAVACREQQTVFEIHTGTVE